MFRTFSLCSDLETKQLAWACYKNGSLICQDGQPTVMQSYQIAGMFRDRYADDLKK